MVHFGKVVLKGMLGMSFRVAGSLLATVNDTLDEQIEARRNGEIVEGNSDTQSSGFEEGEQDLEEALSEPEPEAQEEVSDFVDCDTSLYNTAPEEQKREQIEPTNPAEYSSFKDRYVILNELGAGGFGVVFKCLDRVENSHCAIKCIIKWTGTLDEVKAMSRLRHENIHQYFNTDIQKTADIPEIWNRIREYKLKRYRQEYTMDITTSKTRKEDESTLQVMATPELIAPDQYILVIKTKLCLGSLAKFLVSNPQNRNPMFMLPWIRQIASGLHYLHSLTPKMVHRDLKPANILITYENTLQITDFGLNVIGGNQDTLWTGGTNLYRSPEQCSGQVDPQSAHKMDIWAFGLTTYEMCVPMGNNSVLMFRDIKENRHVQDDLLSDVRELVLNLTEKEPSKRMEAGSVISILDFYLRGLSDFEGTRAQLMHCLGTGDDVNLRMVIRSIWEPFSAFFERKPNNVPRDFELGITIIENAINEHPAEVKFLSRFIKNLYRDTPEESEKNNLTKALDYAIENPEMVRPIFTKVFETERLSWDDNKTNKQRILKLVNHLGLVFNLIMDPYASQPEGSTETAENSPSTSGSR